MLPRVTPKRLAFVLVSSLAVSVSAFHFYTKFAPLPAFLPSWFVKNVVWVSLMRYWPLSTTPLIILLTWVALRRGWTTWSNISNTSFMPGISERHWYDDKKGGEPARTVTE